MNTCEVIDTVDFLGNMPGVDMVHIDKPGHSTLKKINVEGIRLLYGKLRFIRQSPICIVSSGPYVEMLFLLSGSREMNFRQSSFNASISAGHHNLFYIPDPEFYLEPSTLNDESITVQVQFAEEYFTRFMPTENSFFVEFIRKVQQEKIAMMSKCSLSITPEMYILLDNIVHCTRKGFTKQLFIEASVLKLLLLQFDQYQNTAELKPPFKFKQRDVAKFQMVRELLEKNIADPHSLTELARQSGLNDFKLKKGFKELYGITVFGYLNQIRMAKAQELLQGNSSIAEIAEQCGYAYVQSFSTAFKSKFGVSPEKFRK